jgi:hypothetical protein
VRLAPGILRFPAHRPTHCMSSEPPTTPLVQPWSLSRAYGAECCRLRECGLCGEKCSSHCLRECVLQDAGSRHAGGCRKAASTAWMIFAMVPVPPSQRSARFLALPHSGWPTILELTCWVRGTSPTVLEQKRFQSHQIGETK